MAIVAMERQLQLACGKEQKSSPKETAMKTKISSAVREWLPMIVVIVGLCVVVGETASAQNVQANATSAQNQQMQQPDSAKAAPEIKTFAGKIVKNGNMLVLSDAQGKMTYKLDDQQKAKDFLNKDVKVTGVLDDSTGVIRVTAIEPA